MTLYEKLEYFMIFGLRIPYKIFAFSRFKFNISDFKRLSLVVARDWEAQSHQKKKIFFYYFRDEKNIQKVAIRLMKKSKRC